MTESFLRWLATLKPGDVGAYAILILIIVVGLWAIHTDNIAFGPRWRDKVQECNDCKDDKAALEDSLAKANQTIRDAEREDTQKVIELARLRMEREYSWRPPSQQGTTT